MNKTNPEKDFYLVGVGHTDLRVFAANPVNALQQAAQFRDDRREAWGYSQWASPRIIGRPDFYPAAIKPALQACTEVINIRETAAVFPPATLNVEVEAVAAAKRAAVETVVSSFLFPLDLRRTLRGLPLNALIEVYDQQFSVAVPPEAETVVPDEWVQAELVGASFSTE